MLQKQTVISECYILQFRAGEDTCTEHWIATAIFSATRFILRFIKPEYQNALFTEDLRKRALECYHIRDDSIKDFVEIENFDDRLFVASEYNDEKSLALLELSGPSMSMVQLCQTLRTLAQGLQCFHEAELVYGILNADNIIAEIKAGDLIAVKLLKPSIGTMNDSTNRAYLSPECKNGLSFTASNDIYSVGIHMVRLITGRFPYEDSDTTYEHASLRYATNALFRRDIPEKFVCIILKMIISDPKNRYQSVAEILDDLRDFMHIPTNTSAKIPMPSTRTFDSTGYFNAIAEGNIESGAIYRKVYPATLESGKKEISAEEKEELHWRAEEDTWNVDDFIRGGKKTVQEIYNLTNERFPEADTAEIPENFTRKEKPRPDIQQLQKTQQSQSNKVPVPITPPSFFPPPAPTLSQITAADTERPEALAVSATPATVKTASQPVTQHQWTYHRIRVQDVYGIVEHSAKLARNKKGTFRYIQEPENEYANTELYSSFEALAANTFYVNLGSFAHYGTADISDFMSMLSKGFSRTLSRETRNAQTTILSKVRKADPDGLFPIDLRTTGAGNNVAESNVINSAALAEIVGAFARKRKPVVLIIRGSTHVNETLQHLLEDLALTIRNRAVCITLFFDPDKYKKWHALSRLPHNL